MNPRAMLIKIAILGVLLLITIGVLAYLFLGHKANANKPFKVTITQFNKIGKDHAVSGAKIDIKVTRHSRIIGIVIDKPGSFTEAEKELFSHSIIRFGLANKLMEPVGTVTPEGALELKLPGTYTMEAGEEATLGFLIAASCTPELIEKNAKVTFDLLNILILDNKNRPVKTIPRWFPKFITIECKTSI